MVNITSWFLALHPHCVSVDPEAVAKALRWFRQRRTKAFQIYLRLVSPSSWLHYTIKGSGVHWPGFCWQECVTKCVRACCLNM